MDKEPIKTELEMVIAVKILNKGVIRGPKRNENNSRSSKNGLKLPPNSNATVSHYC
jgi:hypothetical protein